jgi:lipid II:glycine glycyltransferase (peptidoglycan interpeptide bridge formation enzyme)
MARFAICYANGVPASATVNLNYKDVSYGWYLGTDRELRSYNPNEMIIWDSLKWSAENGYKVFDFGGAGKANEESGVRDFKLKFRGDLVEYGRNTCVHAPFRMKLAESTYNFSRNILLSLNDLSKAIGKLTPNL